MGAGDGWGGGALPHEARVTMDKAKAMAEGYLSSGPTCGLNVAGVRCGNKSPPWTIVSHCEKLWENLIGTPL